MASVILQDDPDLNPKSDKWSGLQDVNLRRPLESLKMIFRKKRMLADRGPPQTGR